MDNELSPSTSLRIKIKKNEEKILPFIWIDGDEKETKFSVLLKGENASVQIVGIFLGTQHSAIKFDTDVTHVGKKKLFSN